MSSFHPPSRRDFLKSVTALSLVSGAPRLARAADAKPSWQSRNRQAAADLGLPGFVAGVVREGKLDLVQVEGFADLEKHTAMRRDHIFPVASVTKSFTAVLMMQYVTEKKLSLEDYVLDYPFVTIGLTPSSMRDSNTRLKHILSHTSQGTPGDTYLYNGGRYNFIYGAFEKVSDNTRHYEAVAQEFRQRIGDPLGLTSTLSGYPTDKADPRLPRIVTAYRLDRTHPQPKVDAGLAGSTTHYPGTGLLTTVDDLARVMLALDDQTLLSRDSYATMTEPFPLNDGRKSTYGLGWSTQTIGGLPVHWSYGYGDSYSALVVRVPDRKTSFIFLCNSGTASAPFLLGYGNLLTSPFAMNFLREVIPGATSETDDLYAHTFLQHYASAMRGGGNEAPRRLLARLKTEDAGRFRHADRSLIYLLGELSDPSLDPQRETLAQAYDASGDYHPDIDLAIAGYYKRAGAEDKHLARLRRIAELPYGEERSTREACIELGTALLAKGQVEGRKFLWLGAQYAQSAGWKPPALNDLIGKMKLPVRVGP